MLLCAYSEGPREITINTRVGQVHSVIDRATMENENMIYCCQRGKRCLEIMEVELHPG